MKAKNELLVLAVCFGIGAGLIAVAILEALT